MPNFNQITLIGHLTRDPEVRFLTSGMAVCECGIATTKKWKDKQGQKQEKTCFIDLTIWAASGERFAEWFKKGQAVFVQGELEMDQWDDKETGARRSKHKVNVQTFQNCSGVTGSQQRSSGNTSTATSASNSGPAPSEEETPF